MIHLQYYYVHNVLNIISNYKFFKTFTYLIFYYLSLLNLLDFAYASSIDLER